MGGKKVMVVSEYERGLWGVRRKCTYKSQKCGTKIGSNLRELKLLRLIEPPHNVHTCTPTPPHTHSPHRPQSLVAGTFRQ